MQKTDAQTMRVMSFIVFIDLELKEEERFKSILSLREGGCGMRDTGWGMLDWEKTGSGVPSR